jgi:universal stress protein E
VNQTNDLHPRYLRYTERGTSGELIQKILVVVDPTAIRHPCIDKAARLAECFGSTVELYICDVDQSLPESWAGGTTLAQYRGVLRERRLAMLESLAAPLRARGIHVLTESHWHAPLERGIVDHAIRTQADLVVKDTHRHAPVVHMPTAQTDWILIRHLPMPFLLVRPKEWTEHPLFAACVDPCHVAERPLDEALLTMSCSMGRALAGDVSVLHTLQGPPHLPDEPPSQGAVESAYTSQRGAVEALATRAHLAPSALRFASGQVPDTLVQMVGREKPDVVLMGVAARQRYQNGAASTASQVLERIECDLLVMKPHGFVSPALVSNG